MSFLIPPDKIPGRVALLTTLSLCMFNTLNSVQEDVPLTNNNPTALVRWIVMCLFFIVLAMCEFGCLLLMQHFSSRKVDQARPKSENSNQINKWDKLMLLIFPVSFFTYCLFFWTVCYDKESFKF